jgi:hypothetical protein
MGLKILHLSDVHFGSDKDDAITHAFHDSKTGNKIVNPEYLADLIIRHYKVPTFDVIIDSGDLVFKGTAEEYQFSKIFYSKLQNHFKVPIVLVPGNHDVNWSVDKENQQKDYLDFVKEFYADFKDIYPFEPENNRHQIVHYLLLKDKQTVIIGLNSAANLDKSTGKIYVDNDLLTRIEKRIDDDNTKAYCKILVIHHHLFPFAEASWGTSTDPKIINESVDETVVVNSARLQGWLIENEFSLVLHGHRHSFHGRVDTLWHKKVANIEDRRLIIIGGGSAGVYEKERKDELSFNEIIINEISKDNFKITISINDIEDNGAASWRIKTNKGLVKSHNTVDKKSANYFEAVNMQECHEQISETLKGSPNKLHLYNFVSIVHDSKFMIPEQSCNKRGKKALEEDIENSFFSLHPEYDNEDGWNEPEKIIKSLKLNKNNYSINHGLRMFASSDLNNLNLNKEIDKDDFPINKAINKIKDTQGDSKGYVGLYDSSFDLKNQSSVLPGLMAIQFVPVIGNKKVINLVCFFRTIELSFWWVVNMYEAVKLLDYACAERGDNYKQGSITFFSAIARWKDTDELAVAIKPEIENKKIQDLYALVSLLEKHDQSAKESLQRLLVDFKENLSDININFDKFEMMYYMIDGIENPSQLILNISNNFKIVVKNLDKCLLTKENPSELKKLIDKTKLDLEKIIDALQVDLS